MPKGVIVFDGGANKSLTEKICKSLRTPMGDVTIEKFPDTETYVQIEHVRGRDVFVVQPTCPPVNENYMNLFIMLDAIKRSSPKQLIVVVPYFGYARQDRKDKPRVPITAKLMCDFLETAGVDRVLALDLHADQIQGFFSREVHVDVLHAQPVFIGYLRKKYKFNMNDVVIVAPDEGSVKRSGHFCKSIGASSLAITPKSRIDATTVQNMGVIGNVKDKICIITDDMTSTCGTLIASAEKLKEEGAKEIYAIVTHCLLNAKGKEKLLSSPIDKMITTDTVPNEYANNCDRVEVISVSRLLSEGIRCIYNNESISRLIEEDGIFNG